MRIFLTGGTGFLGSHFLSEASKLGHEVVALRRPGSSPKIDLPKEPQWAEFELDQIPSEVIAGCETLVHLAAYGVNPQNASWSECFRWNVDASVKMWLAAAEAGVNRFIIAGSCFEYGKSGENIDFIPTDAPLLPTGPYHSSKAAATMAALGFAVDHQREMIILRPFHIYGPGEASDRFWPALVKAAMNGEDFFMTEGEQIRDFTPVKDVAAAFLNALTRKDLLPGQPIVENVGTGSPKSLIQFATEEWEKLDANGRLLKGQLPMRTNEVMRYVPLVPRD